MKKRNVQTIKHVIGVLTAEGSGNEIIDHCVRELAALIEKDGFREYVRLLARETARELRPKLETVKTASDTASRKEEANPPPETHAETIVVDSLSALARFSRRSSGNSIAETLNWRKFWGSRRT